MGFILGLDLGQRRDYSALCILEAIPPPLIEVASPYPPFAVDLVRPDTPPVLHVRWLERFALGTRYPAIVKAVAQRLAAIPAMYAEPPALVVDATGVGRPVVDLFVAADLEPIPVTITGGDQVSQDADGWRVPKRDLVAGVQIALQTSRLKFAEGLSEAPTLIAELLNFQYKINVKTAHDSYGTWREGQHDDLVLAVALAAWYAERGRELLEALDPDLTALLREFTGL